MQLEGMVLDIITWWAFSISILDSKLRYVQLDTSYNEVFKIAAAGGLDADLHDFRITEEGTAVITAYEVVHADLTELGRPWGGLIWDCLIQEIILSTGELIFQWRAADY